MHLINNFDIYSDFYSDPQLKAIFNEEYTLKVSSSIMWALILYAHPKSKYFSQEDKTRKELIEKDFLKKPLNWDKYSTTLEKIDSFLLSKPQRLLKSWEQDLEERDIFMKSLPYNAENLEIKEKLMTNRLKLWDQYYAILKKFSEEEDIQTRGDTELSLSDKRVI